MITYCFQFSFSIFMYSKCFFIIPSLFIIKQYLMFGAENDPSIISNNQHFLSETTSYHSFFCLFCANVFYEHMIERCLDFEQSFIEIHQPPTKNRSLFVYFHLIQTLLNELPMCFVYRVHYFQHLHPPLYSIKKIIMVVPNFLQFYHQFPVTINHMIFTP